MHRAKIAACFSVAIYASAAHAQVVQLPTFHVFTVNTTVSVPDSGRGFAAALQRSRLRGPMRNIPGPNNPRRPNQWFVNRGHNHLHKVAAAEGRQFASEEANDVLILRKAEFLSRHVARQLPEEKLAGVAEIRRRNAVADQQKVAQAKKFFARGQEAEAKGRQGVAKIYYQMAAKRATGKLKAQILTKIDSVTKAPAVKTGH